MKEITETVGGQQTASSRTMQGSSVPSRLRSITKRSHPVLAPELVSTTGLAARGQTESSPPATRSA